MIDIFYSFDVLISIDNDITIMKQKCCQNKTTIKYETHAIFKVQGVETVMNLR